MKEKAIFILGLVLAACGILSAPTALICGLLFGLLVEQHPFAAESRSASRFLLQAAVVCLGFGMNLAQVVHAARSGFVYTAISISVATTLGLLLGMWLKVAKKASFLITMGTAICGGSAIAALSPVLEADDDAIAVSMGTVFALNSVALLLFPYIGHSFHLSQTQFGLWAALAIHDTSSVVGASAKYGQQALAIGTTVKLARALWIVPVSLATAYFIKSSAKLRFPWFILYFLLAAVISTYLPVGHALYAMLNRLGKVGLIVTLFLIGTGLSRKTLRQVGLRPMLQGIGLWIVIGTASLLAIRAGWIAL